MLIQVSPMSSSAVRSGSDRRSAVSVSDVCVVFFRRAGKCPRTRLRLTHTRAHTRSVVRGGG